MLQNAYFLAKFGADTAENEQHFAENLPKIGNYPTGPQIDDHKVGAAAAAGEVCLMPDAAHAASFAAELAPGAPTGFRGAFELEAAGEVRLIISKLLTFAIFCKLLAGSFSAVSKPISARKYAFGSIF